MTPEFTSLVHSFPLSFKIIYTHLNTCYYLLDSSISVSSQRHLKLCSYGKSHLFSFPVSHLLLLKSSQPQQVTPPSTSSLQPSLLYLNKLPTTHQTVHCCVPVGSSSSSSLWDAGSTPQQMWNLFSSSNPCWHPPSPRTTLDLNHSNNLLNTSHLSSPVLSVNIQRERVCKPSLDHITAV